MVWFADDSPQAQAYDQVNNKPHEANWSHELIAGAASYAASKAYEEHSSKNGPPSHAQAKGIISAIAGAFVDREFETHGLNSLDKEKVKDDARTQAEEALERHGSSHE